MTTLSMHLTLLWQSVPVDTSPYLILGYAVMWLIGTVYIVTLITRQRNLKQDVRLMQQLLEEDEDKSGE